MNSRVTPFYGRQFKQEFFVFISLNNSILNKLQNDCISPTLSTTNGSIAAESQGKQQVKHNCSVEDKVDKGSFGIANNI